MDVVLLKNFEKKDEEWEFINNFFDSSVVERMAVNHFVVGSIPTQRLKLLKIKYSLIKENSN